MLIIKQQRIGMVSGNIALRLLPRRQIPGKHLNQLHVNGAKSQTYNMPMCYELAAKASRTENLTLMPTSSQKDKFKVAS